MYRNSSRRNPVHIRRTVMEVPGNVPRMLDKARGFDADVLMLDLEDSCLDDAAKVEGRRLIGDAVRAGGFRAREIGVRVNEATSRHFLDDAQFVVESGISTVFLPKCYTDD